MIVYFNIMVGEWYYVKVCILVEIFNLRLEYDIIYLDVEKSRNE